MQFSHIPSSRAAGLTMTVLLWLGLGAAGAWWLAGPAMPDTAGLPLAIALLTLFVAAIVATFSLRYMRATGGSDRFFLALGALVAAVLVLLFTDNLLVLGAAWCASGWLLAGLIGHCEHWAEARIAARRTRLSFLVGDTALLTALGLLAWQAGSWQLDAVLAKAGTLSPLIASAAALLLVVCAAARSALPPFSGWLLSSMTAPTPVSALMHAGLVNAGGFLLIRFAPVLEAAPAARMAAVILGLCGALYGIGIMLVRPDVKRALAGSTVSQMGFMVMSCGLGAYAAALWHILAHGLFKAWLFLGSGSTIGMKDAQPAPQLSAGSSILIAAGTIGVALSILAFGDADANLVPLLLGLATAVAMLAAALGSQASARARVAVMLAVAGLIAFHGAGLTLTGRITRPDAPALVPDWALVALLAAFLCAWAWQQARLSAGRGLPLRLYVHLINAGALAPAAKETAK